MKKYFLLISLFISIFASAQVIELAKLSSGILVDRTVLWDKKADDIYGFFYIFEKDKLSKTTTKYEYVLLDKNLNKVFSGEFEDECVNSKYPKYSNRVFWGGFQDEWGNSIYYTPGVRGFSVRYFEGIIKIPIYESGFPTVTSNATYLSTRYRLLDVAKNELSDAFTFDENLQKIFGWENIKNQNQHYVSIVSANEAGYFLEAPLLSSEQYSQIWTKAKHADKWHIVPKKLYFTDNQLNSQWEYAYNTSATKKSYQTVSALNPKYLNTNNILVLKKVLKGADIEKTEKEGVFNNSYVFLKKDNGQVLSEIKPYRAKKSNQNIKEITTRRTFIDEKSDKAILINQVGYTKTNIIEEDLIQGFSKAEYKISTGEEISRNYFSWDQLKGLLDIDQNGFVKEKDDPNCYLYLHDVIMKSNGNMLFILEEYKPYTGAMFIASGARVNDLFFMELNSEMKLVHLERIEKEKKRVELGFAPSGSDLNRRNGFDYVGYQHIKDDDYLFFYYNKQKPETGYKKQLVLGIVNYKNGKFIEQKLSMKSEEGSEMLITPAKKGYIMIYEVFKEKDKSSELRLEKINY
jgi:hypothetical protein